jgi:hypothetical protein
MAKVTSGLLQSNWQKTAGSRSQKEGKSEGRSSTFAGGNQSEKLLEELPEEGVCKC